MSGAWRDSVCCTEESRTCTSRRRTRAPGKGRQWSRGWWMERVMTRAGLAGHAKLGWWKASLGSNAKGKRWTRRRLPALFLLFVTSSTTHLAPSPSAPLCGATLAARKPSVSLTKTLGHAPALCASARLDGCRLHFIASHSNKTSPLRIDACPPCFDLFT
jgi:hypothetical protein